MNSENDNYFGKAFGEFIRDGRNFKKLSQHELANNLGMNQSYLSRIEQGTRNVDFELAVKICSYLDLDLNDFLTQIRSSTDNTE